MSERLRPGGPFQAIAHRGDPIGHRENTLPAISSALAAGADLVEIDVKTTASGDPVLLHDLGLERLWEQDRMITDVPTTELPSDAGQRIPLLAEALELIGPSSSALLIDLDHPRWTESSMAVIDDLVRAGTIIRDQVVWCGRPDAMGAIRSADDAARIVLSWDESNGWPPPDGIVTELQPEAFNPHWPMLTDADGGGIVRDWIAAHGLATCAWTVDDDAVMRDLIDRGVTAIITNRIHRLQELRIR